MNSSFPVAPLRFEPSFEQIPADEVETTRELVETMRSIAEKTSKDYGHAVRSVHAKSHGLLDAELSVLDGLPFELAQGVFSRPGTFDITMRFSTNPGDVLDDNISTPRGLAIKIDGVAGERLPGSEDRASQDFVLINAPAFIAATPKEFLSSLKMLAKTTDRMPGGKKVLSAVLRGTEHVIEAVGGESGTIKSLGGHPKTHILGETFYTCAPLMYGPYFAKLSIVPVSPELAALADSTIDMHDRPNALRDAVNAFFASNSGEWEVRVQLATSIDRMPVEDASVVWPEDESPYIVVATIRASRQAAWTEDRSKQIDDGLLFSPWNGIVGHRPIGGVMRARKPAYEMSSEFRGAFNQCPIHR